VFKKLQLKIKLLKYQKDKLLLYSSVALTVIFCIWAFNSTPPTKDLTSEATEMGTAIPKGFSIIPLELANAPGLSALITKNGIIDVYRSKSPRPLIENLRVIKLSAGEGPLFGALIPEDLLGRVQDSLTHRGLRGVLKSVGSGMTKLHFAEGKKRGLESINIGEEI
jgi:hypothetical protein